MKTRGRSRIEASTYTGSGLSRAKRADAAYLIARGAFGDGFVQGAIDLVPRARANALAETSASPCISISTGVLEVSPKTSVLMIGVLVDAELTRGFAGAAVIHVAVLVAGVGDAVVDRGRGVRGS